MGLGTDYSPIQNPKSKIQNRKADPARAVALMSVCVAFEREIGHPDAEADAERVAGIQAKLDGLRD